ncbi:Kv channel-interacting protein 1-like isoform X2 [Rhopilema esculentum]|uniref:Kv channel-interacting protein 1-like isoform X2 n=1 Tax=Rhopilema esculentum TaxID=499914 RepID=UPI0031DA09B3
MGQSSSKEATGSTQIGGQTYGQSLVSSSRTSTSSFDSWDSYPALIPSRSTARELRIKEGDNIACRIFKVLGFETTSSSMKCPDCPPVKSLDELVKCTKFSRIELQHMYEGFKNDCPAGIVNRETFKEQYANLFPEGDSSLYANVIFNTFDTNKDGKINFQDFVIGLSETIHCNLHEKLRWTFRLYDVDGDGILTKEELVAVLDAVYRTVKSEYVAADQISTNYSCEHLKIQEYADELFMGLDKNGNGVVAESDFVEACLNDRNLLSRLAVANQYISMTGEMDETANQDILHDCSCASSYQSQTVMGMDMSPTLLCRNLVRSRSFTNLKEEQHLSYMKEDLELSEF